MAAAAARTREAALLVAAAALLVLGGAEALSLDLYEERCPDAEAAVNGEASQRNDLGQSSTLKFLHRQSEAPRLAAPLQVHAAALHGIRLRGWQVSRWGCRTDGRGAPSCNGSNASA